MRIALQMGTLATEGFSFERSIEVAESLGFQAVEVWMDRNMLWPLSTSRKDVKEANELLEAKEIDCVSTCPIPFEAEAWETFSFEFNLADPSEEKRRKAVEFFKKAIDLTVQLGAKLMLTLPGKVEQPNFMLSEASYRRHWNQSVKSIKECASYAEELGVALGVENAVVGSFCDTPYELKRIVKDVDSQNVKVYLDIANANTFYPPMDYVKELKGLLAECIHVTDNDGNYAYHLPIGMGTIDFHEVIMGLEKAGWNGYLLPEVFYKDDPIEGLRISKEALEKLII